MTTETIPRTVKIPGTYESISWKWMRISALLLIPLVWGHVLLQDIIVGVFAINLDYVAFRWSNLLWRIYDGLLLAFAFAHGMNGLRQVLFDYIHGPTGRRNVVIIVAAIWLVISVIGFIALIGGVNT